MKKAFDRPGYARTVAAAKLARQRRYRFRLLLPDVETQGLQGLQSAATGAARDPLAAVVVSPIPGV